jgi:hypothetical protein
LSVVFDLPTYTAGQKSSEIRLDSGLIIDEIFILDNKRKLQIIQVIRKLLSLIIAFAALFNIGKSTFEKHRGIR